MKGHLVANEIELSTVTQDRKFSVWIVDAWFISYLLALIQIHARSTLITHPYKKNCYMVHRCYPQVKFHSALNQWMHIVPLT